MRACSSASQSVPATSIVLAQDEARTLKHNYIGTEHILLGLLREQEGVAARVLRSLDITVEEVRAQVARIVGQGDEVDRRTDPVHAACQEGAGAGVARGAVAGPQLHRHRAHPAGAGARERGRCRPHPARLRRRRREDPQRDPPGAVAADRAARARPAVGPPDRALPELRRAGRVRRHQDGPGPLHRRGRRRTDVSPLRGRLAPQLPRGVEDARRTRAGSAPMLFARGPSAPLLT